MIENGRVRLIIAVVRVKVFVKRSRSRKIVFILGTPEHNNIGDLAIIQAEVKFLKKRLDDIRIITIPFSVLIRGVDFLKRIVTDADILIGHGGGNMGDTYVPEEEMRRLVIGQFPRNKIVVFPQTVHFSQTASGALERKKSQQVYSNHKNLTLIAREKDSYAMMRSFFPDNTVLLTPDIVLSLEKPSKPVKRSGALSCIRNDRESRLNAVQKSEIDAKLRSHYRSVTHTDTVEPVWLARLEPNRFIIYKKLSQFRKAEVIVTDRLHGMVLAAITGTPCIALANFNHKVKGTFEWIQHLGYVRFIDGIEQLEDALFSIDKKRAYAYDTDDFRDEWAMIVRALDM